VVCTLSGINTPRKTTVTVAGWAQITTGAATTALTARIRRGTDVTGTLIDEANPVQVEAAAGSTEDVEITVEDEGVDLANATYVLTVQQTAATGNGTCVQAAMEASHER
jgi:hypothetical protein